MPQRALVLLLAASACLAAKAPEPPTLRLPTSIVPVRYSIDLRLVPGQDSFQGVADIAIDFRQPAAILWLHATQLDISQASLQAAGQTIPASVTPGGGNFLGFEFPREIAGPAALHIVYQGRISNNSSAGLFQLTDRGQSYIYSQFEPTDARRAFPCFDEPSFKAPWQLTLHVRNSDMALSNTPIQSQTPEAGGMRAVRFAPTKPLPSYLVALAVGPFDAVDAGKVGRVPLRVIVPHGRGGEAKFAAQAIPPLLKLLEEYFGIPFPYEKLDSVVMPISNFAMENAGLITYGQSLLLSRPEADSFGRQRSCAIVVAHEMAHQWFGDLVTTAWWNDIWLNEAFATWMESKIVDQWKPEWNMPVSAVKDDLGAMELDSLISVRKIRQPITSDNDIANAFDGITYQKGAGVIRMFEHWTGPENFRKGVRQYLRRHANSTATTADFEAAIGAAAGRNIAPAFDSFLDQPGVPVVTASLDCNGRRARLLVSQQRSLPIGSSGSSAQLWLLPVCVKYELNGEVYNECQVLADPRSEIALKQGGGCPEWVLANAGHTGYYRVLYSDDLLPRILSNAGEHLTTAEITGVLGDVHALIDSGQVAPQTALSLVSRFSGHPEREVVQSAFSIAREVNSPLVPGALRDKASAYIRDVFGARATTLGWTPKPGEDENSRLLRESLVAEVAREGHVTALLSQARDLAVAWLDNRQAVAPGMAGSVLAAAAETGDRGLFDRFHAAARKESDPRAREQLIHALGAFRDPELSKQGLALLLSGDFDMREALQPLLFGPLRYPETRSLPFEFLKDNIDALIAKLPREVGGDFAAELPGVGSAFCGVEKRREVELFFKDRAKEYTGGARNLAKTLESIDLCIAQKKVLGPQLAAFLESRRY